MPPIVCLVGRPDSGKTTLLEKLLPLLRDKGYRIGTVKHHVHDFQMDTPGKDTWRHKQAGAAIVALSSPTGLGVICDVDHDTPLAQLVSQQFADMDLVIAEGYKQEKFPKIEIHRREISPEPLPKPDSTWRAYVSDAKLSSGLPIFALHQIEELADFLIEQFIPPGHPKGSVHPPLEGSTSCGAHKFHLSRQATVLQVNGQTIPMKPFLEGMIRNSVLGLISTLKGCRDPHSLTLTITNGPDDSSDDLNHAS